MFGSIGGLLFLRILLCGAKLPCQKGIFETGWQQFGGRLTFWNRLLTARATELNNVIAHLDQLGKTWEQTLALTHNSGAPAAILQRVQDLIVAIGQTHEEAEKQLAYVLTLQSGVAEQERRVDAVRHALEQARKGIVDRLFVTRRGALPTGRAWARSVERQCG